MRWRLQVNSFLLPKEGMSADECEDAICFDEAAWRFALADGATEAFDARTWARMLVESWAAGAAGSLVCAGEFAAWLAAEGARLDESWAGRKLSWYGAEKLRAGSFAAFVGVEFEETENGLRYRAIALGDSCLVRCRHRKVFASFPLDDASQFTSAPFLAPSRAGEFNLENIKRHISTESNFVESGDVFYLLSDAIAAWFLSPRANRSDAVTKLDESLRMAQDVEIEKFLRAEKLAGNLKDDDVAMLRVAIEKI